MTTKKFSIKVSQAALDDLHDRLGRARWPDELPGVGWARGVPVAYAKKLASYWRDTFDWRAQEAAINRYPQFTATVDGVELHFLHARSSRPNATPLMLIHGWPGSFVEFLGLIGPLTDPQAYGANPSDAFHVVIPSIPGQGFSASPCAPGWTHARTAGAFSKLMSGLGYKRYGVQGGDIGAIIAPAILRQWRPPISWSATSVHFSVGFLRETRLTADFQRGVAAGQTFRQPQPRSTCVWISPCRGCARRRRG